MYLSLSVQYSTVCVWGRIFIIGRSLLRTNQRCFGSPTLVGRWVLFYDFLKSISSRKSGGHILISKLEALKAHLLSLYIQYIEFAVSSAVQILKSLVFFLRLALRLWTEKVRQYFLLIHYRSAVLKYPI